MKNLKKLGKVLSTKEQKNVNGGGGFNVGSINFRSCVGKNPGDACALTTYENGYYEIHPNAGTCGVEQNFGYGTFIIPICH